MLNIYLSPPGRNQHDERFFAYSSSTAYLLIAEPTATQIIKHSFLCRKLLPLSPLPSIILQPNYLAILIMSFMIWHNNNSQKPNLFDYFMHAIGDLYEIFAVMSHIHVHYTNRLEFGSIYNMHRPLINWYILIIWYLAS